MRIEQDVYPLYQKWENALLRGADRIYRFFGDFNASCQQMNTKSFDVFSRFIMCIVMGSLLNSKLEKVNTMMNEYLLLYVLNSEDQEKQWIQKWFSVLKVRSNLKVQPKVIATRQHGHLSAGSSRD